jgi:DNA-binding beta-propeller fold protein YncE
LNKTVVGFLISLGVILLSGCAETRYAMQYGQAEEGASKAWPAKPDPARFRFVGELTGEKNFQQVGEKSVADSVSGFFKALIGLGSGLREQKTLQRPQSGVVGPTGRIFVTDTAKQAVFVFDETAGKLELWHEANDEADFVSPVGIAIAKNGDVLVADSEQRQVFRLSKEGKPLSSFGYGEIERPTGLAIDPATGRIYVADTAEHNIKVYEPEGTLVAIIGSVGTAPGEFNAPTHLAFSKGKLYVTDTFNARIQVLDTDGKFVREFGKRGLYIGNLVRPKGVAVDSEENVYVIESFHDYLLVFDNGGRFLLPIGGTGSAVGQFYLPAGVWTDGLDRIYVADMFNGRVMIFQYQSQKHPPNRAAQEKKAKS